MERFKGLSNLPKFDELEKVLKAFLEEDKEDIERAISDQFANLDTDFLAIRFFKPFITYQSNKWTHDFKRKITISNENVREELELTLTETLIEAEQYLHLFKKAAIYVDMMHEDDIFSSLRALDPTQYFREYGTDNYFFINKGIVYYYVQEAADNVRIYFKNEQSLSNALTAYNTLNNPLENGFEELYIIDYNPFTEWSYNRVTTAKGDELTGLQTSYIRALTWGLYNAERSMVKTTVVETNSSIMDTQTDILPNLGKTDAAVKTKPGDRIYTLDQGSVDNLVRVEEVYEKQVTKMALLRGVPADAVVNTTKVESGTAKQKQLDIINDVRKTWFTSARRFESRVVKKMMKALYPITEYRGIEFSDIKPKISEAEEVSLGESRRVYAKNMNIDGYWTFAESIAYVRESSLAEAEAYIKENKLTDTNQFI